MSNLGNFPRIIARNVTAWPHTAGDVIDAVGVRLLGDESSQGKGELQLFDYDTWAKLCAGSLGPIEGQLACRELGFGLVKRLGVVDE